MFDVLTLKRRQFENDILKCIKIVSWLSDGEFPNNIRANNKKILVLNNKNEMSFTKHQNKIVYEKVLLVKIIHNSKD